MANKISMSELMSETLNKIQNICYNIEGTTKSFPGDLVNNATITLYSKAAVSSGTVVVSSTISDSLLATVPLNTVKTQLTNFLSERGITTKVGAIATSKSILNFFNNVAAFLSTKILVIIGPAGGKAIVYNNSDESIPTVSVIAKGTEVSSELQKQDSITVTDIQASLSELSGAVSRYSNAKMINSTVNFVCSCSSSSCSCSSSSSSCSSSSSSYIVYMMV